MKKQSKADCFLLLTEKEGYGMMKKVHKVNEIKGGNEDG